MQYDDQRGVGVSPTGRWLNIARIPGFGPKSAVSGTLVHLNAAG